MRIATSFVSAVAAILAGVLRAAGCLSRGEVERQSPLIVDLLLPSVFAAYTQNHEALGCGRFSDNRRRYPPGEVKPRGSRP